METADLRKYEKAEQLFYELALKAKCEENKEMQESIHIALESLMNFNDSWGKLKW